MFVEALERVDQFTRAIHFISRYYGSAEIIPQTATMFFVNENGWAVTCKHVAENLINGDKVYAKYLAFKKEFRFFQKEPTAAVQKRRLEEKYSLNGETLIRVKNSFPESVTGDYQLVIHRHPVYDLAIVRFVGYSGVKYRGFATFLKDEQKVRPGRSLCRLGYPFPEFTNYRLNTDIDDIEWSQEGKVGTPGFPIDGIITRQVADQGGIFGIEMSTPGLRGQSGGPLFDKEGIVYGMQSATQHLHLGFDQVNREVISDGVRKRVSNYPFLNVGRCVHVRIIKEFLREKGVKFYEG
ncbi:MAG: hypothetical protein ABS46_10675 [Cytophagaceae bacterium SCN 52-12]|nr:MAG: hypothetical protein ABS46_10675 [Cytophagaceae bacterium SCN 52-12]